LKPPPGPLSARSTGTGEDDGEAACAPPRPMLVPGVVGWRGADACRVAGLGTSPPNRC
jgi:hypothetical protein